MSDRTEEQRQLILDQFTRQAVPFAEMPAHSNDEANLLLIDMAQVGPEDTVLDVACGPGLVGCALAEVARHVTGIDLTPAMIEQAQVRQRSMGLANLTWLVGDAVPLPFPDASFSAVVTRYSFHHFLEPKVVLAEMVRVCRPGGGSQSSTYSPAAQSRPRHTTEWRSFATPAMSGPCRWRN